MVSLMMCLALLAQAPAQPQPTSEQIRFFETNVRPLLAEKCLKCHGDKKQWGLLDDTLIWWGSEFGRTPTAETADGRDHNPDGFTMWLAGGGVKGGFRYGSTDDYGYYAAKNKVHLHDFHATLLHALGLDHQRLTYRHAGRDFRLTDVEGNVVHELFV